MENEEGDKNLTARVQNIENSVNTLILLMNISNPSNLDRDAANIYEKEIEYSNEEVLQLVKSIKVETKHIRTELKQIKLSLLKEDSITSLENEVERKQRLIEKANDQMATWHQQLLENM